ncbi:winged helix-turn-helix domain-containing protein [Plantactinospora sp. S1510]|uniref:Winged helix-turn-helix domain-containing protein n=1 Tax=Plantactinospora alkalitolerans TaxID=2789879 RepID=A0ABS0GY19_9ACTN|nr:BTAD domain-containing putative transcriptional regulator [Plantactinospora alkalitolerans]MBF9131105.1 winged helix-turn-helix domain-containing protein [Plantactinospora alkalitolerans]
MESTVRVLGPIEVHLPSGVRRVRGSKPLSLLAILLSQANRLISVDRLVTMLWDTDPPRSAVANLRTYVRILRQVLSDTPVRLEREPGGYLLRVTDADSDHLRFAQLVAEASAEAAGPTRAVERLEQALQLWRGVEAAAGVPRHGAVGTWLDALDEQRMRAVERIAEARIATGEPDRAVRELADLLAVAPLRSRAWWLKILAHHRLGEHDLALAGYRSAADVFRDELGIEPDPELTELYRSLLHWDDVPVGAGQVRPAVVTPIRGGLQPDVGPPNSGSPAAGDPVRPYRRRIERDRSTSHPTVHGLPEPPALIGRRDALTELRAAILGPQPGIGPRVVVLHGPPGVGTSALAQRAAYDLADAYPDGQLHLDVRTWPRARRSGAGPVQAVLRRLGVGTPPDDVAEAVDLLQTVSAGLRLLLVMDNVSAPGEVRPMLSLATGCCLLLTSGYPLGVIPGAGRLALRPLNVTNSVEVLRSMLGRDRVGEEFDHLAVLCGGLPLALRIVAARLIDLPALSTAALIGRLRDERRALSEWEVDDLSLRSRMIDVLSPLRPEVRYAFARLAGPREFGVAEAARRLNALVAETEALLDELVRTHLLVVSSTGRYRMPRFARLLAEELRFRPRCPELTFPSSA